MPWRADRVITGTKDNQLLVWDVKVDRHVCLPSYISEGWRVDHCGIHSIAISPQGVIASGGQAPQVSMRALREPRAHTATKSGAGAHDCACDAAPSQNILLLFMCVCVCV